MDAIERIDQLLYPSQFTNELEARSKEMIDARELHLYLKSKRSFWLWLKSNIDTTKMLPDRDYTIEAKITPTGSYIVFNLSLTACVIFCAIEPYAEGHRPKKYLRRGTLLN